LFILQSIEKGYRYNPWIDFRRPTVHRSCVSLFRVSNMADKKPAIPQLKRESSRNLLAARSASAEHAVGDLPKNQRYPNLFFIPHKAFRLMFFDTYEAIGNTNFQDDDEMLALQKLVDTAVFVYTGHNHEEDTFFCKRLAERDHSGLLEKWNEDHKEHSATLRSFKDRIAVIVAEKDFGKREKALADFYQDFGDYLAADLAHMNFEERTIMPSFWAHFTDEELAAIEQEFMKQVDPAFMQAALPYVLRGHNISTRIGLLKMMQATNIPPEQLQALVGLISLHAKPKEMETIKKAIGLA